MNGKENVYKLNTKKDILDALEMYPDEAIVHGTLEEDCDKMVPFPLQISKPHDMDANIIQVEAKPIIGHLKYISNEDTEKIEEKYNMIGLRILFEKRGEEMVGTIKDKISTLFSSGNTHLPLTKYVVVVEDTNAVVQIEPFSIIKVQK